MSEKMLQFNGLVREVSPDAALISIDGVTGWIPDSLTDYIDEPIQGEEIEFLIPEWLAENKGFI